MISEYDDVLDSRDVEERIEELREEGVPSRELDSLKQLKRLVVRHCTDSWEHGVQIVRKSYIETYAREYAEDTGGVPDEVCWPYTHIDWEAAAVELFTDWAGIEWEGVDYYVE